MELRAFCMASCDKRAGIKIRTKQSQNHDVITQGAQLSNNITHIQTTYPEKLLLQRL
jgi:hypothetical protein